MRTPCDCARLLCLAGLAALLTVQAATAGPPKPLKRIEAVMVGDRLVDVAMGLGLMPEAVSVRSLWPRFRELKYATAILGCPRCVTVKRPDTVAEFMKKRGLTRLIIEKSDPFCLYMKKVDPMRVAALVKDVPGLKVEYVDFTKGAVPAIEQASALFGLQEKGRKLAAGYEKALERMKSMLPGKARGKRVLVLKGTYIPSTGKSFVQIEAPGGYADAFLLEPLGCENAAKAMIDSSAKVAKGHVPANRLAELAEAAPDAIAATGDSLCVQLALARALRADPSLAEIPAFKNAAVYSLPAYVDSSVLEYPQILNKWRIALER